MAAKTQPKLRVRPLTPDLWPELCTLFGPKGACGGCWCMTPRLTAKEYAASKGDGNRRLLKRLVDRGDTPGVLAFANKEVVGWCAIDRREAFRRLATSRVLKPVDDQPVWSIPCLFIKKSWRRRGVSRALIQAAVRHAKSQGAKIIEAYPVEPTKSSMPDVFAWTGIASTFQSLGFTEVARRSKTRPIFRV